MSFESARFECKRGKQISLPQCSAAAAAAGLARKSSTTNQLTRSKQMCLAKSGLPAALLRHRCAAHRGRRRRRRCNHFLARSASNSLKQNYRRTLETSRQKERSEWLMLLFTCVALSLFVSKQSNSQLCLRTKQNKTKLAARRAESPPKSAAASAGSSRAQRHTLAACALRVARCYVTNFALPPAHKQANACNRRSRLSNSPEIASRD